MMKAVIEIKMDNAAFGGLDAGLELARILRGVAQACEEGRDRKVLFDVNGNNVGEFKIVGAGTRGENV